MHTDPIADMLTRIRNAARAGHKTVRMPASKMKESILAILVEKGFLAKVTKPSDEKFAVLEVTLHDDKMDISADRKSKPGRRKYLSSSELRPVRNGYGVGIISTSRGIMTLEEAKEKGVGGEYICAVY